MRANDLQRMLQDAGEDIDVTRKKANSNTLDMGSIIVAVVASPLLLEAAKALGAWLMKNPSSGVTITNGEGSGRVEISATGLTSAQVEALVREALTKS